MKYESFSPADTERIASGFAAELTGGDVVCLYGELGTGKTAFTKGIAKALGVDDCITSPTFTIVNEYEGRLPLYHFDVYRIASSDEMYEIGFDEYIYSDGVSVIEWSELIEDILPERRYNVRISKSYDAENENYRLIEIMKI